MRRHRRFTILLLASTIAAISAIAIVTACSEFGGDSSPVVAPDAGTLPDGNVAQDNNVPTPDAAAADAATYTAVVLQDSPLAYLRFGEMDGSTTALNVLPNFNATYSGGVTLGTQGAIAGDPNTAVSLDGMDSCIDFGSVDVFAFSGKKPFTFEAWIKPANDVALNQIILSKVKILIGNSQGWMFRLNPSGKLELLRQDGDPADAGSLSSVLANTPVTPNIFSHVVITYDGTTNVLYMNSVVVGSKVTNLEIPYTNENVGAGCRFSGGSGGSNFEGVIDELAIYNTALAPERIAIHYAVGKGGQ